MTPSESILGVPGAHLRLDTGSPLTGLFPRCAPPAAVPGMVHSCTTPAGGFNVPRTRGFVSGRRRTTHLEVERLESREVLSGTGPSTPLNDLGTGFYNGQEGGLYPNGTDVRPASMEAAAE